MHGVDRACGGCSRCSGFKSGIAPAGVARRGRAARGGRGRRHLSDEDLERVQRERAFAGSRVGRSPATKRWRRTHTHTQAWEDRGARSDALLWKMRAYDVFAKAAVKVS